MLSGTLSGSASLLLSSKSEEVDMEVENSKRNTAEDACKWKRRGSVKTETDRY